MIIRLDTSYAMFLIVFMGLNAVLKLSVGPSFKSSPSAFQLFQRPHFTALLLSKFQNILKYDRNLAAEMAKLIQNRVICLVQFQSKSGY